MFNVKIWGWNKKIELCCVLLNQEIYSALNIASPFIVSGELCQKR